jgi:AraC-like DNA-binding protein
MHESPAQAWSLGTLAAEAGMSRSVFANTCEAMVRASRCNGSRRTPVASMDVAVGVGTGPPSTALGHQPLRRLTA